jgi:hypothetical protein
MQEWATNYVSLSFPPFLSSFISLCTTQGHPFEASSTHSNIYLQHGFKVLQQKLPFPNATCISICPHFYNSNLFCLHHSSTSTPHIIYHFLEQHVYSTKSLTQRSSIMTSLVSKLLTRKKIHTRKTCLLCSFILPLILPCTVNYTNFSSMQQLPPPSIAQCRSCSP